MANGPFRMFAAFIGIVPPASQPMTGPSWYGLSCSLAWPIPAVMVVWDRSLVLRGAVCMHVLFSASAILDPPSVQKSSKMPKCVGVESRGCEARGAICW